MKYFRPLIVLLMLSLVLISLVPAAADGPMTYEQALECVQRVMPASGYFTSQYLPTGEITGPTPGGFTREYTVRVGFPWVANDEEAQLYIAQELGYFAEEGITVTFVSGGPGKDHIQSLGGGAVDIGIAAAGSSIMLAKNSTTPIAVTGVGAMLKDAPLAYLTILPELQGRELTVQDLVGRTIGVQPGGEIYVNMMLDRAGIAHDEVTLIDADFTPAVLWAGRADFYSAWIMNQPRLLEQETADHPSYRGRWNALMFSPNAYSEPSDVIAVRDDLLATADGQDMVRRFLRAVYRGTQYMLSNPVEAATITVRYAVDAPVTQAEAELRFSLQEPLVRGAEGTPLMAVEALQWDNMAAYLLMYEQLSLDCGGS